MYKVFAVAGGYQIFWCPSAPLHFNDCVPYVEHRRNSPPNGVYASGTAAYRRRSSLNKKRKKLLAETDKLIEQGHGASIL